MVSCSTAKIRYEATETERNETEEERIYMIGIDKVYD